MSTEVVKQVFSMVLDVTGFTDAADEALDAIDELKEALDFSGIADGISQIGESTKNMGFNALEDGLVKVQNGFSELDLLALKVLDRINTKIVDVGINLGKAITTDPVKSGLEEYETQIDSVQTILANTGDALKEKGLTTEHERIEKINGVLDELNHYADMTIYNFTEMTRNIGTFTAAGVDLDTAATAIQGIANLAAMSGSNSQQASTVMYQLSQALASGTVKLQDWNSVVNAGMGGKLFQNELIETAKAMHTADDIMAELDSKELTFRDSLQEGWLTSDVLINTLEKFTAGTEGYTKKQVESMQELWRARGYSEQQIKDLTGTIHQLTEEEEKNLRKKWEEKGFSPEQIDHIMEMGTAATDAATKVKTLKQLIDTLKEALQSGWTQSWEYIFGDFEQAKRFWTEISDIMNLYIGKSADSRNAILETWAKAKYSYNEDNQLIDAETGEIIKDQKMLASEMGGRELVIQGLRNSFQSLLEIVFQLKEAFRLNFWGHFSSEELAKMEQPLSNIMITGQNLIDLSRKFEGATASFKDSLTSTDRLARLREVFDQFATSCRTLYDTVATILPAVGNIFDALFHSSFFNIDLLGGIAKAFDYVVDGFSAFGEAFNKHFGSDNAANREGLMKFFSAIQGYLESSFWTKLTFIKEAWMAFGAVIEHLIEPFGTISEVLGYFGEKISGVVHAFDEVTHFSDGESKIVGMFGKIATQINNTIDAIGRGLDFSGFTNLFDNIIGAISDDKVRLFGIFSNTITGLTNIFRALLTVVMPIATAFTNVFGPAIKEVGEFIFQVAARFRQFTESLVLNEEMMHGVETLFTGIFNVLKAVAELIGNVLLSAWDSLGQLFSNILPDSGEMSNILVDIGNALTNFSKIIESLVNGDNGVPKLSDVFGTFAEKVGKVFEVIKDLDPLQKLHDLLDKIFDGIKHALGGTDDMSMLDTILNKVKEFVTGFIRVFSGDDGKVDFDKVFTTGGIVVLVDRVIKFFERLKDSTKDVSGIIGIVKTLVDGFAEALEAVKSKMKVETIKTIADAILEIAAALFVIAMIDPVALAQSIAVIKLIFESIDQTLTKIAGFQKGDAAVLAAAGPAIAALGTAILMLSFAIAILGGMDFLDMAQGLGGVIILLQALTKVAEKLSEIGDGKALVGTMSLIFLAGALDMLIIPVKVFGEMDLASLAKGLIATSALLAELVGAAYVLGTHAKKFKMTQAIGLILMAEAVKVLAKAVILVKDLSWEELAKGLAVFATALIGMVGAAAIISKAKLGSELMILGTSLMMLGATMKMFASALTAIGGMSWEDLGKGLAVFAAALIGLGIASYAIKGSNLLMIGAAIFLIATAISELVVVFKLAEAVGPIMNAISQGFVAIKNAATNTAWSISNFVKSMAEFTKNSAFESFLDLLKRIILFLPEVAVGLAKCIIEFVVALGSGASQLVGAVVQLGSAILQGLTQLIPQLFQFLGTLFTQIWTFLTEQIPQAFATLGVFFTQLFGFLTEQIPNLFGVLGIFFTELFAFLTEQTPHFFEWLNTLLSEFINFMSTHSIEIIEAIRLILDTILQAIITEAPKIGEAVITILSTVLQVIQTTIPQITETILMLITSLLTQLATYVPQMADAALKIINGFLTAIAENLDEIIQSGIDIALSFIKGVTEKLDDIVDAAFKLIIGFIEGLAKAIDENHNDLYDAIGHLITAIFNAIVDGVAKMAEGAGKLISGFLEKFDGKQLLDDLADVGKNLVQGIINGITGFATGLWDTAGNLGTGLLTSIKNALGIQSPSTEGYEISGYLVEGLTNGINDNSGEFIGAAGDMAMGALDALSCLEDNAEYSPTLTPVLDTSGIQDGMVMPSPEFQNMVHDEVSISTDDVVASQKQLLEAFSAKITSSQHDMFVRFDEQLKSLQATMQEQTNAISNLKVVMDNGSLVGQLSPGIDSSLGNASMLSRRGVI